jgi:glycerophosphoryl diester phosphodiesterase
VQRSGRAPATSTVAGISAVAAYNPAMSRGRPRAIAHRGASACAPEHTAAAYQLALDSQADFVEQDLAVTRDGTLICLHDDTLERTSDIATLFPERASRGDTDAPGHARWFANDFTNAEVGRLDMGGWFDARFAGARMVTWQDAIDLIRGKAGLYPELKSPAFYLSRGVDVVAKFVESVKRNGLDHRSSLAATPLVVQSFDAAAVRRLADALPTVPRILLVGSSRGLTDSALRERAAFATGIGLPKTSIQAEPGVVRRAHEAGLTIAAYTFRDTSIGPFRSVRDEMSFFLFELGVDELFTDNPDEFPRP